MENERDKFYVTASRDLSNSDFIELRVLGKTENGISKAATRLVYVDTEPSSVIETFLRLTFGEAQRLFDTLWECGFRSNDKELVSICDGKITPVVSNPYLEIIGNLAKALAEKGK